MSKNDISLIYSNDSQSFLNRDLNFPPKSIATRMVLHLLDKKVFLTKQKYLFIYLFIIFTILLLFIYIYIYIYYNLYHS